MYCMYKAKPPKKKRSERGPISFLRYRENTNRIHTLLYQTPSILLFLYLQDTAHKRSRERKMVQKKIKSTKLNKKKNTRAGKFSNSNVSFRWIVRKMKLMQMKCIFTWPVTTTLLYYFLQVYKSKKLPAVVLEDEKVTNLIP